MVIYFDFQNKVCLKAIELYRRAYQTYQNEPTYNCAAPTNQIKMLIKASHLIADTTLGPYGYNETNV